MAKKPMKMRRRRPQQEMNGFLPLLFIALVALALFSWQVSVLFLVGLAPSLVLGVTGKGVHKTEKLQCVGFSNIAGIIPFAMQVWSRPRDFSMIVSDPINLVAMFGSAAIGYALIYVGPMVAAQILQVMAQDKLKTIAQQRQALLELWGPEVLGDPGSEGDEPAWAQGKRGGRT
ncbi:hypothetical protein [Kordiimonas aestuarii]|uniref:hypothetical protein n=1 Tax=Kordiimonas aestuarii TaxID=1005925 RepID=UPI0021CEC38C|nr:hypothetical protein [Kordiimonas aestuarii]